MNYSVKIILLTLGILVLLATSCDGERQDGSNPAGDGRSPGSGLESKYPTATPPPNVGDGEHGQERDAILDKVNRAPDRSKGDTGEAVEGPAAGPESRSGDAPVLIPTGESGETGQTVSITESNQAEQDAAGPKVPVSGEEPEGIPSQAERDAILDRVNQGPVRSGRDSGGTSEGPAPGTESGIDNQ